MRKLVIAINGTPTAGKDTFCDFVIQNFAIDGQFFSTSISSVDQIKDIATQLGWNGVKDDKSRQFLSDLKDLSTAYNDGPFRYIQSKIAENFKLIFVHIREIPEIEKLKNYVESLGSEYGFRSVKVIRESAKKVSNNTGDNGAEAQYDYSYYVHNNGTLEQLDEKSKVFQSTMSKWIAGKDVDESKLQDM